MFEKSIAAIEEAILLFSRRLNCITIISPWCWSTWDGSKRHTPTSWPCIPKPSRTTTWATSCQEGPERRCPRQFAIALQRDPTLVQAAQWLQRLQPPPTNVAAAPWATRARRHGPAGQRVGLPHRRAAAVLRAVAAAIARLGLSGRQPAQQGLSNPTRSGTRFPACRRLPPPRIRQCRRR